MKRMCHFYYREKGLPDKYDNVMRRDTSRSLSLAEFPIFFPTIEVNTGDNINVKLLNAAICDH